MLGLKRDACKLLQSVTPPARQIYSLTDVRGSKGTLVVLICSIYLLLTEHPQQVVAESTPTAWTLS